MGEIVRLKRWYKFLVNDQEVLAPSQEDAMHFYHCFYPQPIQHCHLVDGWPGVN